MGRPAPLLDNFVMNSNFEWAIIIFASQMKGFRTFHGFCTVSKRTLSYMEED